MAHAVISFIVGCLILLYLKVTGERNTPHSEPNKEPEQPVKQIEEVEVRYKYREEKPVKKMPGESVDFEEIKD